MKQEQTLFAKTVIVVFFPIVWQGLWRPIGKVSTCTDTLCFIFGGTERNTTRKVCYSCCSQLSGTLGEERKGKAKERKGKESKGRERKRKEIGKNRRNKNPDPNRTLQRCSRTEPQRASLLRVFFEWSAKITCVGRPGWSKACKIIVHRLRQESNSRV